MNEPASLLHASPQLPLEGRWIPVAYPPGALSDLAPDLAKSVMVDVRPGHDASPYDSAANVAAALAQGGGEALHGWNLTQFHSSREKTNLIEATPHVLWVTPRGEMVDATPSASSDRMQSCFAPVAKAWKVMPGSMFFVPAKTSQTTIAELRLILEAKHTVRKFMQKQGLRAGHPAAIDLQDLLAYSRSHVKSPLFDTVFQFIRLELVRQKVMGQG